jgi:hypothetical protein
VLEHAYAATGLAALLLGEPIGGLGAEFPVCRVAFQAGAISPVDDVVVTGRSANGEERWLAVAVRRAPTVGPSDSAFVALVSDMLQLAARRGPELAAGTWRIGLAVAGEHAAGRELAELADLARRQPDANRFRAAVSSARRLLRERLRLWDAIVDAARQGLADDAPADPDPAWSVLSALFVIQTWLEGVDAADRVAHAARLAALCTPPSSGAALWTELYALASTYAPAGATIEEWQLRRDLRGKVALRRSPRHETAWRVLDVLADQFRVLRRELSAGDASLRLERRAVHDTVRDAIRLGDIVLVTGAPDTGKSAAVVSSSEELQRSGAAVLPLNLRDAPATPVELAHVLQAPINDVIGDMEVADLRAVIIDGAEAVLEGRGPVLQAIAAAARDAGCAVVLVARDDATDAIIRTVRDAVAQDTAIKRVEIPGLSHEEVRSVVDAFPVLQPLANEPRGAWLLRRPGLVDLLLRADAVRSLPSGAVAEADVLSAVWADLVRNGEAVDQHGATADGREHALLALAWNRLGLENRAPPVDGTALRSLRSDQLLRREHPIQADEFHNDLVRDFAVAVIIDREGFSLLRDAQAPRWAVRAAALACQLRLVASRDVEGIRRALQAELDALASDFGERWGELVSEAYLAPRISQPCLPSAWPALVENRGRELDRLIRILLARHSANGALDPTVGAPLVELLTTRHGELAGLPDPARERIGELFDAWLAGLAVRGAAEEPEPLRQRVRDLLLADHLVDDERGRSHDHHLERLALLGTDADQRVVERLRLAARERADDLDRVVEEPYARLALAAHRPDLLLELAEAYYIEPEHDPADEDEFFARSMRYGDGIRDHRFRGLRSPRAAPYLGPFALLLQVIPIEALAFINRLLNRAASERIASLNELGDRDADLGLALEVCGLERRRYRGDAHVWGWYRGGTVGPEPATSALMAVEVWADQMLALGVPAERLGSRLLTGAESLAMPGLLYGILVRHLERGEAELTGFLVDPAVWALEFGRVANEVSFLVRRDPADLAGAHRRRASPRDVAAELVVGARLAGDDERLARWRAVADELERRVADGDANEISVWASSLRLENFRAEPTEDGVAITFAAPPEIEGQMAEQRRDLEHGMVGWRLLQSYASDDGRALPDISELQADLQAARRYADRPPASGPLEPAGPPAAVAAIVLRAHGAGLVDAPADDLAWALHQLVGVIEGTTPDPLSGGSVFRWGADRSAAHGLPATLLPAYHEAAPPPVATVWQSESVAALQLVLTSPVDEVRRLAAAAFEPVWHAPCGPLTVNGECRHAIALRLVIESARHSRLGPHDRSGYRQPLPVEGPTLDGLAEVAPGDLMLDWLTGPIAAAAACARADTCASDSARTAVAELLAVHLRALPHYIAHHYRRDDADREPVAAAILSEAARGRPAVLDEFLDKLRDHPVAIAELLEDMMRVATYDPERRADVVTVWPTIMDWLVDAAANGAAFHGGGRFEDRPLAAAVPVPRPTAGDPDIDGRIRGAAEGWPAMDQLADQIERWLPHAVGSANCVDAAVGFLRLQELDVQADPGLRWVRVLVDGGPVPIAQRSYLLTEWLEMLPGAHTLTGPQRASYQIIVDGLAAAGDRRAQRLQAAEE